MNKQEIVDFLQSKVSSFRIQEHPAIFTMEEMEALHLEEEEQIAKNLFLRDDKKRAWWLVSVCGDARVDLKQLRHQIGSRPLSFASEADLDGILQLQKGSVTPLGALNDADGKVHVRIDDRFRGKNIGVHPMENTATAWLPADELLQLLKEHGTDAEYFCMENNEE